ncbi:hypothetical protein Tco_0552088 [Tanacetum coccineum]
MKKISRFRVLVKHLQSMGGNDDEAGSSRSKLLKEHYLKTVEEVLLPQVHHEFLLWEGCNKEAKSRMECDEEIDEMLRIKLREAGSNETYSLMWHGLEILTSLKQFIQSFAMSFIQPMNLMKFGLYHADELDEEGFDVYLQGGALLSRKHRFPGDAQNDHLWLMSEDYWVSPAGAYNPPRYSLNHSMIHIISIPTLFPTDIMQAYDDDSVDMTQLGGGFMDDRMFWVTTKNDEKDQ